MFLTTYVKETPDGNYKADIHQLKEGFEVRYFKPTGEQFKTETYTQNSIHYVKDAVENWITSIKMLNG